MNKDKVETYQIKDHQILKTILRRDGSTYTTSVPLVENLNEATPEVFDICWLRMKKRPVIDEVKKMTLVDLFSGTGPMSLGIVEAGRSLGIDIRPKYALDFDKSAALNYQINFPDCRVVNDDINTILDGDLGSFPTQSEQKLIEQLRKVDIVIGGPPCQGHSDLNNHTRRDDPRNQLIFKFVRFVELFLPDYVVIENVQGIRHDKHNVLGAAKEYLSKLGYNLKENLLLASNFGVAQHRRRFILVCTKTKIDFDLSHYIRDNETTVEWAISDLMHIERNKADKFNTPATHSKVNQERIQYLFDHNIYELPNALRPKCQQKEDNRYTSVYSRMYPNRPSPTITSGFGSIGQGRFGHPFEPRSITPHEAARLQFIPDFFIFSDSLTRVALQTMIGNAVPPKLTYIIGLELLR